MSGAMARRTGVAGRSVGPGAVRCELARFLVGDTGAPIVVIRFLPCGGGDSTLFEEPLVRHATTALFTGRSCLRVHSAAALSFRRRTILGCTRRPLDPT